MRHRGELQGLATVSGRVNSTRQVGLVGRTLGTTKKLSSARALALLRVLTRAIEPERREEHNRNNGNVIRVLSRDGVFCQNQTRTVVEVVVVEEVFKNI